MATTLLKFYQSVLGSASMVSDEQNQVSFKYGDKLIPTQISGKRLCLPTQEGLRNKTDKMLFMHPLVEGITGGESPVMEKLRTCMMMTAHLRSVTLITELLNLGVNIGDHSKTNSEHADLLMIMKDVDKSILEKWLQVASYSAKNENAQIVHIFLKRQGAKFKGVSYGRGAVVTFPLYKELKKGERKLGTITLRNRDREVFLKLMEYVFPGIDEEHRYSAGSNSDIGPFFDALLHAVHGLGENINQVADLIKPFAVNYDMITYDLSWMSDLQNISDLLPEIRAIPLQEGNRSEATPTRTVTSSPIVQSPPPLVVAPAVPRYVQPDPSTMIPARLLQQPSPEMPAVQQSAYQKMPPAEPQKEDSGYVDYSTLRKQPPQMAVQQPPQMQGLSPQAQNSIIVDPSTGRQFINVNGSWVEVTGSVAQRQPMYPQQPAINPMSARAQSNPNWGLAPVQQVFYDQFGRPVQGVPMQQQPMPGQQWPWNGPEAMRGFQQQPPMQNMPASQFFNSQTSQQPMPGQQLMSGQQGMFQQPSPAVRPW